MEYKIVIACSSPKEKSEPFIEHIKQKVKGKKYFLYGDNLPLYAVNYGSLAYYPHFLKKGIRKIRRMIGKTYDTSRVEGIKKFLVKNKIQLVLSEFGSTGAKMAPICRDLNIFHIVHFFGGGDVNSKINIKNYKDEYLFLFKYASAVICVSEDMKYDLNKIGCELNKIHIIPCGVEEQLYKVTPDFNHKIFLFVGRFVDQKAPYYLLESFKKVLLELPDAKLVMVGDGYLHNTILNLANLWKISSSVVLSGYIEHSKLIEYYEKSFCYVQHSIVAEDGCAEGTPVSLLEASFASLPVISTRHKGIRQAVIENVTGFLVEEHDAGAMADCMIYLAKNTNIAKQMGEKGREYIKNNYSMKKYISSIDDLISNVIGE